MPAQTPAPPAPAWTIPDYLEARDGRLHINGADSLELVRQYNSPLYVFSEPRIRSNIARPAVKSRNQALTPETQSRTARRSASRQTGARLR